jgi:hypothetical protein
MNKNYPILKRENHLNHMTNVVPILTLAYAVQSYMFLHWNELPQTSTIIILLGITLALAVFSMVFYDLNHKMDFFEDHLIIHFKGHFAKKISYNEIDNINFNQDANSFSHLYFTLNNKRQLKVYFVDNAQEIKEYIQHAQKASSLSQAA